MTIQREKKGNDQLGLFEIIRSQEKYSEQTEGSLNIQGTFRRIISSCISKSKYSRWQIAAQMSELLGIEITIHMLNAWTAESKDYHRFPAEFLPAFCVVLDSCEPLKSLAQKIGMFLMPGPEAIRAEIQKIDEQIQVLKEEKDKRLFFLKESGRGLSNNAQE